jgi:hypothetical protein
VKCVGERLVVIADLCLDAPPSWSPEVPPQMVDNDANNLKFIPKMAVQRRNLGTHGWHEGM